MTHSFDGPRHASEPRDVSAEIAVSAKKIRGDSEYLCAKANENGDERFDFAQLVTLQPGIKMRTRPHWCPELETLAVNVLLHSNASWRHVRDSATARRLTKPYAKAFALECLAPFSGHSWLLSKETVVDALSYLATLPNPQTRVR